VDEDEEQVEDEELDELQLVLELTVLLLLSH